MWTSPSRSPANRMAVSVLPIPSSPIDLDLLGDRRIAFVDSVFELAEDIAAGLVVVEVRQRGDHQLGGHLAGGVAAHAVGQRQQPAPA